MRSPRPLDVAFDVAARLADVGLPSPAADARILLAHAMGLDVSAMMLAQSVSASELAALEDLVADRCSGVPVQHLTGVAPFRYETLRVGPGVFIPRPETEPLVDLALGVLADRPPGRRRVVELCAGSGAITLALAHEIGGLELHVVEVSVDAWPYLKANLDGVGADLVLGDMADAFSDLEGCVDLVVANPPYVPEALRGTLPEDVEGRDPDLALFGGPDGLDALRVVVARAKALLRPGGWAVVEHDESHGQAVVELFRAEGFRQVSGHLDLAGRPRHVRARSDGADDMAGLAT